MKPQADHPAETVQLKAWLTTATLYADKLSRVAPWAIAKIDL